MNVIDHGRIFRVSTEAELLRLLAALSTLRALAA
jgi:hypothetical protein